MSPFFADYVPDAGRAVGAAAIQAFLLGVLSCALFSYASQRHPPKRVFLWLGCGGLIPTAGGLIFFLLAAAIDGSSPLREVVCLFFEFYLFAILGFPGLLAGWICLEFTTPGSDGTATDSINSPPE